MSSLLRAYVQNKSYKDAVKEFYDTLAEIDAAKHFLFLAKKDQIIKDLKKFWPYVTTKSEREYKNTPIPSATHNIQLPSSQFHVVSNTLEKALIKHEIRNDQPSFRNIVIRTGGKSSLVYSEVPSLAKKPNDS
jgi:hypothetical protein